MPKVKTKIITVLGIDPGLAATGYGLVKKTGPLLELGAYGCLKTTPTLSTPERLAKIYHELKEIITAHQPKYLAVEELFFYKNVKTALAVGQARGIILLLAAEKKLPLKEYTPLEVKQAIVGYGRAEKSQIKKMVKEILNLKEIIKSDDAADALAVALCALQTRTLV